MNTCKNCEYRLDNGYCGNDKLAEKNGQSDSEKKDMMLYSYDEGGSFWVGENFGCIHKHLN